MTQERIEIQFEPKGDKELILAIKQLDIVTKRLKGTTSKYEKELKDLTRVQDKFNISSILGTKSLRNMGGATLGLTRIVSRFRSKLLLASFALGGFNMLVKQRVEQYRAQIEAEQALVNNLQNVDGAAKNGAKSLIEYAAALQSVTTFGDEQIIQAASQLATYQLNEKAIAAVLPRLLDMTSSTGTLEGNTIALGKAFTGQIGSLSRYGVVIDKAKLEIARSKGVHEEFNFIIQQLDNNYKGLAETLALTPVGQLDQMENEISDLNEELGRLGLPFLKQWTELKLSLTEFASWIGILMEELQKRSGNSWLMGLLDSVLIFSDLGAVLDKVNKRFEKHKKDIIDSTNAHGNNNQMVATAQEQISKYNNELAFNISLIKLSANQANNLTEIEAKLAIIKEKTTTIQNKYNEGLITYQEYIIDLNTLIIEQSNIEQSIHDKKIANSFEIINGIQGVADAYVEQRQATLDAEKATALAATNSIRSERLRARAVDKINEDFAKKQEELNKKSQKAKRTQTVINNAAAIMEIWADKDGGTFFKIAMSALVAAQGQQQLKAIDAAKYEQGGLVGGRRHSQGGTVIEAERGEYVVSRRGVDAAGLEALNRINAGQGAGGINISINNPVLSKDVVEDDLIPQIKEAIRRGADIGVG